jgi:hypothetical protein
VAVIGMGESITAGCMDIGADGGTVIGFGAMAITFRAKKRVFSHQKNNIVLPAI